MLAENGAIVLNCWSEKASTILMVMEQNLKFSVHIVVLLNVEEVRLVKVYSRDVELILHRALHSPHFDLKWDGRVKLYFLTV